MRFSYTARTKDGSTIRGSLDAVDRLATEETLRERGFVVLTLTERRFLGHLHTLIEQFQQPKLNDIVVFLRQFSIMVAANVPIVRALHSIARSTVHPMLRTIILDLVRDVESGRRLSDALAAHPRTFSAFAVHIVRAGETSGSLEEVIAYLADKLERDAELRAKVRSAMIYPAFILSGLTILAVVMMVFVIPRLTDVLAESGAQLPAMTRGLIAVSSFMVHWGWVLLVLGVAAVVGIRVGLRLPPMRHAWDAAKLRVPIFGRIMQSIAVVRFARSFDVLLRGGVDVVPALVIVRDVVGNAAYATLFDVTIREVEDGNPISSAFARSTLIPSMVTQLLTVGEETGQLQAVLRKIAEFFMQDVDQRVRNLVTIIEPLIMVVMGVAVGVMVAAVIMPMYSLASQF